MVVLQRMQMILCVLIWAPAALSVAGPPKVIYVDPRTPGANDGSSWRNAYVFLQDALAAVSVSGSPKPVEIRVAQGIYRPDRGRNQTRGDRTATFQLVNGVMLRAGYAGSGTEDPNARDIDRYETVLSGDLAGDDLNVPDPCDLLHEPTRDENSYHVVTGSDAEPNAVIEGFTITAGSAEPFVPTPELAESAVGGAMYVVSGSPTVVNCRFTWNLAGDGGAVYAYQSNMTLSNCTFSNNMAGRVCTVPWVGKDPVVVCSGGYGGGIESVGGSPKIRGCTFAGNSATYGGAISNRDSSPVLEDCIFSNNAAYKGGGVQSTWNSPKFVRCTFHANVAFPADTGSHFAHGGALANDSVTDTELVDCIFVENWAMTAGGAMDNSSAELSLVRCRFTGNRTPSSGAALRNWESTVRLSNCLFEDNVAGEGTIYNNQSNTLTLVNCTLVGNSAKYANGFLFRRNPSTMQLSNCIVRNGAPEIANDNHSTISIAYTNITGGWPGEGNMGVDPRFSALGHWDPNGTPDDPNDNFWVPGDYHLKSQAGRWEATTGTWVIDEVTSPCIDAGDPNSPVGDEPEPNGGRINMGAYGGTAEASKSYSGG